MIAFRGYLVGFVARSGFFENILLSLHVIVFRRYLVGFVACRGFVRISSCRRMQWYLDNILLLSHMRIFRGYHPCLRPWYNFEGIYCEI